MHEYILIILVPAPSGDLTASAQGSSEAVFILIHSFVSVWPSHITKFCLPGFFIA